MRFESFRWIAQTSHSHSNWNEWVFCFECESEMLNRSGGSQPSSILIITSENTRWFAVKCGNITFMLLYFMQFSNVCLFRSHREEGLAPLVQYTHQPTYTLIYVVLSLAMIMGFIISVQLMLGKAWSKVSICLIRSGGK